MKSINQQRLYYLNLTSKRKGHKWILGVSNKEVFTLKETKRSKNNQIKCGEFYILDFYKLNENEIICLLNDKNYNNINKTKWNCFCMAKLKIINESRCYAEMLGKWY